MKLSKKQRKLLKKEVRETSLDNLAKKLKVDKKELANYLKKNWRKEKFERIVDKKQQEKSQLLNVKKIKNFSFAEFIGQNWLFILLLSLLSIGIYLNSLPNQFLSDDIATIIESPNITNASYFITKEPPFFSFSSFLKFVNYNLFGLNPVPFRLVSIFAHWGSTLSVFILLGFFFAWPINFFSAAIFAVHPILSESVVWISAQPYPTSSFLVFTSFIYYLLYKYQNKKRYFYCAIFSYLLVFFASEKMITYPIMLAFYELLENQLFNKKTISRLIPFVGIASLRFLGLLSLLKGRVDSLRTNYYQTPGLENPLHQIPVALATYLELIFWPIRLVFYHSEETILTRSQALVKYLIFAPYPIILVIAFVKKQKALFFWLTFFLITLLPVLTPFRVSWIVAERYVYLGTAGIIVFVAFLLHKIGQLSRKEISWGLFLIIIGLLSFRTFQRNDDYKNQDTLWLASAKYAPSSPQNHNNLGDLYARRQEWDKAIEAFQTAIKLKPNYADAYHNLGNTYRQNGDQEEAIQSYQKATQFNHNLWQSYQNLGALYYEQQQLEPAAKALKKATQINPNSDQLYANLGTIYLRTGQIELAKQEFQKALNLNPENERAQQGTAVIAEQEKESSPISN